MIARVAIKKTAKSTAPSTGTRLAKPKLGSPAGSKNRSSTASVKAASRPTRSTASRKTDPVAPRLNKAELEVQLAKFEHLVACLRKQNKELKAIVKSAEVPKEGTPAARPARRVATPAPATKTRKPRTSKSVNADAAVEDADPFE